MKRRKFGLNPRTSLLDSFLFRYSKSMRILILLDLMGMASFTERSTV